MNKIGLIPPEDTFKRGVNLDQYTPVKEDFDKAKEIIEGHMDDIQKTSVNDILNSHEDVINEPSHYKTGRVDVIDFIEDYTNDFRLANVIKYIARAGKKNPDKFEEDIKKAQWYLNRYVEKEFGSK